MNRNVKKNERTEGRRGNAAVSQKKELHTSLYRSTARLYLQIRIDTFPLSWCLRFSEGIRILRSENNTHPRRHEADANAGQISRVDVFHMHVLMLQPVQLRRAEPRQENEMSNGEKVSTTMPSPKSIGDDELRRQQRSAM